MYSTNAILLSIRPNIINSASNLMQQFCVFLSQHSRLGFAEKSDRFCYRTQCEMLETENLDCVVTQTTDNLVVVILKAVDTFASLTMTVNALQ